MIGALLLSVDHPNKIQYWCFFGWFFMH